MKTYEFLHRKNITSIKPILFKSIDIGSIITFGYSKSDTNKRPIVLVLNQKDNNDLLHGFVIDYISIEQFSHFKNYIINENKNKNTFQTALYKLTNKNPKIFYESKLKKYIELNKITNIYRTYKISEMTNIRLVNYNFDLI